MSDTQGFRPVKVKIKSGKQKSMKYISGDLLYSGVNLFGKLSEIYLEKIKNGEMFTGAFTQDVASKDTAPSQDIDTPSLVKKSSTVSSASTVSQATNQNLKGSQVFQMDQEIMSLFRKLQKKDAVTKIKALKALAKYVHRQGETEMFGLDYAEQGTELSQVLTFFLYHFERIITYEVEKGVREAAHDVLAEFLTVCKKNFAQHIINLFPLWYISWYDTAQEIRTKAKNNFMETFKTPEIRSNLFRKAVENMGSLQSDTEITISQNYLNFIQEKVLHFEMLLSEDMTTLEKPQRDSIYDRIISGCLESLADSFDTFATLKKGQKEKSWRPENTSDYITQIVDIFSLDESDHFPAIYKFLGAKFHSPVRAGALKLVEKMTQYMIGHDEKNKEIFETHIHKLSNSLFSAIADDSSQVQRILWRSVLFNVCTQFKDTIWHQIDIKKGVLPQLHTSLKNAGFGAHTDLYKNFVAVISIMPIFDFDSDFETVCKLEQPGAKKPIEEVKETEEDEEEKTSKKSKKKQKKSKGQEGGEKTIKNSFSISEKLNVMYDLMKSLFSAIEMEEAIAFDTEIIDSYYDTMSFLMLKKIIPAIQNLKQKGDEKSLGALEKKFVQTMMYPVSEYLKKNDPSLNRSVFRTIPSKFASTLTFLASKNAETAVLAPLFADLDEMFKIGLEKSPQNTIKFLSTFLSSTPSTSGFYPETQNLGVKVLDNLYEGIRTHISTMSKDTIQDFSKTVDIFSFLAHSMLTQNNSENEGKSVIFSLTDAEKQSGEPAEHTILMQLFGIIKLIRSKMKKEFLDILEDIQETLWLVLVLRCNFLLGQKEQIIPFMDTKMLDLIFEGVKDYGISDDRYLNMVIQYISPADCLQSLVSESIQKHAKIRASKGAPKADQTTKQLFVEYENYMRNSTKVQDNCLKVLFIDMIDDYSQRDQIMKIYGIFKRKVEDYVDFKQNKAQSTILTEDSVKSFLESTMEFLQESEQVHKSYQLSELGNVLAKLILNTTRHDALFPLCYKVCQQFFKILLKIQQNLSSAVEQWKFIRALLANDQINHNNEFLTEFIEKTLQQRIEKLSKLSNYEENEFNKEILILRNLINSIPREKINVVNCLSRIILHEENFSMLAKNCLILKVFQQTFLAGGIGFNIDDIALQKDEFNQFKYIWLICELLTAGNLPSLAGYMHLRTQIQIFCESEVYPLILRECCSESDSTLFFSMILYLTQKSVEKSSLYAKTLGNILEMLIKPPEGLYELVADFNRWKDLLDVTIGAHIESVLSATD